MSRQTGQDHISKKAVVYGIPGMDAVTVRRDLAYRTTDAGPLTLDIYEPPGSEGQAPPPAVILVAGYPDPGFRRIVGCGFKEMGSTVAWARLIAASGIAAIAYTNREPVADLHVLLEVARHSAASWGIDETRIGLWASSGNVPLALSLLIQGSGEDVRCAVLFYGYMFDSQAAGGVAEAAGRFGFVNPCEGKTVGDLAGDVPLFIARAGQDEMPRLNEGLDAFLAGAVAHNLPVTFTNHASGPHAFDVFQDSEASREVVRLGLEFLRFHLLVAPAGGGVGS